MTDLSLTIAPKSDQLNADDLIAGPMTIHITKVSANPESAEQPISIFFDGDNGKPYKPCKSMRRVLVQVWGKDGTAYPGRSMVVYRDPKVQFGGLAVGGIRISHMSHIEQDVTMALTATRASRKPFTVKPLAASKKSEAPKKAETSKKTLTQWFADLEAEFLEVSADDTAVRAIIEREETRRALGTLKNGALEKLHALIKTYKPDWVASADPPIENAPENAAPADDIFPGDLPSRAA
jgi:hypothetical protein